MADRIGRTRGAGIVAVLLAAATVVLACLLSGCGGQAPSDSADASASAGGPPSAGAPPSAAAPDGRVAGPSGFDASAVPAYSGEPSAAVNGNAPFFTEDDIARGAFEEYSPLDGLGRCGPAFALVGPETAPDGERGSIGMVRPSGWRVARYGWVDGGYLFNRCHLVAFSLAGENDNELNLITGTRSMNVRGMLPYEERVAAYVDSTGNHVLYRATPVFEGDELVARGVLLEARSAEDGGEGVGFCAWCYNVEPGVVVDYATGASRAGDPAREAYGEGSGAGEDGAAGDAPGSDAGGAGEVRQYVLNASSRRFHRPGCPSVSDMAERNKIAFEGTRDEAVALGYRPCGACRP